MLEELKSFVCAANIELMAKGIVIYTWGNVSGITKDTKYMVIKPSGVGYDVMKSEDMVVIDVISGEVVEGNLKPSSDTNTHLEIYRAFPEIGGITHTHSINATAYAQAGMDIPALGTTHADYFFGNIPCTRELTKLETEENYETNTGKVIVQCIKNYGHNPLDIPGILVKNHGPFAFGKDSKESVYHAVVMEIIAEMNIKTLFLNKNASMQKYILDKHYKRKHGVCAYYGQN